MASTVEQVVTALASAYPIVAVVSPEEDRIERLLQRVGGAAKPNPLPLFIWNCLEGFSPGRGLSDPQEALQWVVKEGPQAFYLFKDLSAMLNADRFLLRRLRDTASAIRNTGKYLFLLGPAIQIAEELKPFTYVVNAIFPDEAEVQAAVQGVFGLLRRPLDAANLGRIVSSLRGMSLTEVEHVLRRLLARHHQLTEDFYLELLAEK